MIAKSLLGTGDSWKELAESSASYTAEFNPTVQKMITRMNDIWPFSEAMGIFDNGCGTGTIICRIIDQYGTNVKPSATILAGDFSEHMLDVLRKTRDSQSKNPMDAWARVDVRKLDAQDLASITDGSMSHVTAGHVYFLLPDPQKALRETKRALCSGGVIACTSGQSSQHIDALNKAVGDIEPGTNFNLLSGPWTSEEGVKEELARAGFVEIETHLVESSIRYETHQQFAKMLLQMPVMKNVKDALSENGNARLHDSVVEQLRLINSVEPSNFYGVTVLALARKLDEDIE
jgi:ubiquinone/menaquinone biosynthesis C-methylase UbiE